MLPARIYVRMLVSSDSSVLLLSWFVPLIPRSCFKRQPVRLQILGFFESSRWPAYGTLKHLTYA